VTLRLTQKRPGSFQISCPGLLYKEIIGTSSPKHLKEKRRFSGRRRVLEIHQVQRRFTNLSATYSYYDNGREIVTGHGCESCCRSGHDITESYFLFEDMKFSMSMSLMIVTLIPLDLLFENPRYYLQAILPESSIQMGPRGWFDWQKVNTTIFTSRSYPDLQK
jgi:hypothetical protein